LSLAGSGTGGGVAAAPYTFSLAGQSGRVGRFGCRTREPISELM